MISSPKYFWIFSWKLSHLTIKELGYISLVTTISVPPGKELRRGARKATVELCANRQGVKIVARKIREKESIT